MGKFTFSKARRKPPPQLEILEPMSKAHKILGSTPINIDSPKTWDDGSSGFSAATSNSTVPSYVDDDDNHHVSIVRSEAGGEWSSESDMLPTLLEDSSLEHVAHQPRNNNTVSRGLRKSRSSSTIKSWYEKTNPLAQHAPFSQGPPAILQNSGTSTSKSKKKPNTLDFSNVLSGSRISRKNSLPQIRTDGSLIGTSPLPLKSPSIMSLMTPNINRFREPRKIQKRRTNEQLQSPALEIPRPATSGSRLGSSSSREVPSLYDHYEQMTLRNLLHDEMEETEDSQDDESRPSDSRDERASEEEEDMRWSQQPETPRAAAAMSRSRSIEVSPTDQSLLKTTSPRSQPLLPKSSAKPPGKGFKHVNLQEQSVLMLSDTDSDEDDDIVPPKPAGHQNSSSTQFRHKPSSSSVSSAATSHYRTSRAPSLNDARGISRTTSSKRTSFASKNTYFTIPNTTATNTDNRVMSPVESRSNTPFGGASCRTSIMSNFSTSSAMTIQSNSVYIQEARAITMLPARRPSNLITDRSPQSLQHSAIAESDELSSVTQDGTDASSDQQLTPPLSPTSVDFYIRSAHSSIDGPGNRFIAATREEELMLATLRPKQLAAQENTVTEEEEDDDDDDDDDEYNSGIHHIGADMIETEIITTDGAFDFGFPAPPSARQSTFSNILGNRASHRLTYTAIAKLDTSPPRNSVMGQNGSDSQNGSPARQQPLKGILKKSTRPVVTENDSDSDCEDAMMYLANGEPSPDLSDFNEFGYLARSSLIASDPADDFCLPASYYDPNAPFKRRDSASMIKDQSPKAALRSSMGRMSQGMTTVPEDEEPEAGKDLPRPDSPIAPDSFPSTPSTKTTTLSSMARLSAVGPMPLQAPPILGNDD